MARWNRAYRGKARPDGCAVVSVRGFRRGGAPPAPCAGPIESCQHTYLGDIAICPAVARRNARRLGRTLDGEMRILILHGILHLMGYDHERDTGQMERRERRLRRALGLG